MCGSQSHQARPSQSGAIAVIHRAQPSQQLRLLFHNPIHPATAPTHVICEAPSSPRWSSQVITEGFVLQIHQHGDLTAASEDRAASSASSTLYPVQFKPMPHGGNEAELGERLDLSVGGTGVIGRMVSVVGGGEHQMGDGIVGWN